MTMANNNKMLSTQTNGRDSSAMGKAETLEKEKMTTQNNGREGRAMEKAETMERAGATSL